MQEILKLTLLIDKSYVEILNDIDRIQKGLFCFILPPELCNTTYLCADADSNNIQEYCTVFGPSSEYFPEIVKKSGLNEKYIYQLVSTPLA